MYDGRDDHQMDAEEEQCQARECELLCNPVQSNPSISITSGPGLRMLIEGLCMYRGFVYNEQINVDIHY